MVDVPWLAGATLAAGVANAGLVWYLWPRRDEPGGRWFLAVIGVQVLWCTAYGLGLLVVDPLPRLALEALVWVAVNWIGVTYVAFALEYTGRGHLLRSGWFKLVVGFEVAGTALVLTNPWHHLVWSQFRLDPVFGAATVSYVHEPWVFLQYASILILASLGFFVLLDTVVSYGPLYRRQALALALTPLPPAIAFTAWTFKLGPYPQLNLTPIAFIPHMVLDSYALFSGGMFEFKPTTRRTAERIGFDDLGSPIAVVDTDGRVVNLNAAAEDLFDVVTSSVLGIAVTDLYEGDPVPIESGSTDVTIRTGGESRAFVVSGHPLRDAADTVVGYTLDFRDVTERQRREQRLAVLNRVLRHNLRNDLGVVGMTAGEIAERTADPELRELAETIETHADDLVTLGEKARRAADALESDEEPVRVDLNEFVTEIVRDVNESAPDASVTVDIPSDAAIDTRPTRLALALENAIENAFEHGGDPAHVEVAAEFDGDDVQLTIRDHGPGIPEHERAVVADGDETALEHGSGIGLWLIAWGIEAVGGRVRWETPSGGGTVVRITLPGQARRASD